MIPSLAVQRDGEIAAVECPIVTLIPSPATKADPNVTLPSSKYFVITPTRVQPSLLHHKKGNPCAVSIFIRYYVCIICIILYVYYVLYTQKCLYYLQDSPRLKKNLDRADDVTGLRPFSLKL